MIIECEKCRTQFRLEDPRIYGRSLKVQCSKCDNTFIVESVKPGAADVAKGPLPTDKTGENETAAPRNADQEQEPENPAPEDQPITETAPESAPPERGEHAEETGTEPEGVETSSAEHEPEGLGTPVTTGTFLFSREEKREPQEDTSLEEEQGGEETCEPRDDDAHAETTDEMGATEPLEERPEEETLPLPEDPGIEERERLEEDAPAPSEEEGGEDEAEDEAQGAKKETVPGVGEVIYDLDVWKDELRKSLKEKDFSIDLPLSEADAEGAPEDADKEGFEPGRALTFEVDAIGGKEDAEAIVDAFNTEGPHQEAAGGGGASRKKVFTAIIAAIAVGVFVAWGVTSGKFSGIISTPPAHERIMEIDALKGFFVINKKIGKVFVIEARLKNITDKPQETGGVRGVIYLGRFSGPEYSPTISPGRVLSPAEIKDLSKRDIERRLGGASRAVIPPKGTVPVMIIFTDLRRAVSEYGIDIMK